MEKGQGKPQDTELGEQVGGSCCEEQAMGHLRPGNQAGLCLGPTKRGPVQSCGGESRGKIQLSGKGDFSLIFCSAFHTAAFFFLNVTTGHPGSCSSAASSLVVLSVSASLSQTNSQDHWCCLCTVTRRQRLLWLSGSCALREQGPLATVKNNVFLRTGE